MTDVKRE